jgi:methylated-DNA-[protein]-cysteine S-methyltransferase
MTTGVALFETAVGDCGIAWNDAGVCGMQLPESSDTAMLGYLRRQHPDAHVTDPPPEIRRVIERVTGLLAGERDDLCDIPVDLSTLPDFSRRVLELTREVGPGETTTYGEIAKRLDAPNAAREVGQALGHNPVPIIVPCHRVLGAGGRLVGFSAPGGVATKLKLLAIEDATYNGQPALF